MGWDWRPPSLPCCLPHTGPPWLPPSLPCCLPRTRPLWLPPLLPCCLPRTGPPWWSASLPCCLIRMWPLWLPYSQPCCLLHTALGYSSPWADPPPAPPNWDHTYYMPAPWHLCPGNTAAGTHPPPCPNTNPIQPDGTQPLPPPLCTR